MTAYSFKKQFVEPIRVGLGVRAEEWECPKRQTIRADRKRHARPGEEIQLYCGMRTKGCFLIGRARCVSVEPIVINLKRETIKVGRTLIAGANLSEFARSDGFEHWMAMRDFWRETHGVEKFEGVLIQWEPL